MKESPLSSREIWSVVGVKRVARFKIFEGESHPRSVGVWVGGRVSGLTWGVMVNLVSGTSFQRWLWL